MKHTFIAIIGLTLWFSSSRSLANSEMRDWKMSSGEQIRAEIESIDEEKKLVRVRAENGIENQYAISDFSPLDQAWLVEWIETAEEMESKVAALGGKLEHAQAKGATTVTDYYVYHPSMQADGAAARPMMILFDPSGKGRRYLLRHIEAGESAKITLVSCDVFRNHMEGDHLTRFREMLEIIRANVPHDPTKMFLGGTSGGAWRAFNYSARFSEVRWAGIYSNGGWLGGMKDWELPYPAGMRVAMVNGNNDLAANNWLEADTSILQKRNITVSVHAFEGGHQIPPSSVQTKAFRWLLGEIQ